MLTREAEKEERDYKDFIKLIHEKPDGIIELRSAPDGEGLKSTFKKYSELDNYKAPQNENVYIGLYTRSKGKGITENCLTTNVLWADYDNKSLEEVKKAIKKAHIPIPTVYVSSGYGIHAYWKLSKRADHKAKAILGAIAKMTGADLKATDIARIMRLPGTNNVKYGDSKPCRVLEMTKTIYDIQDIKEAVKSECKEVVLHNGIKTGKPCIDNMIQGVGQGHRNFALGRITKHFQRNGYTRRKALDEVLSFNLRCTPPKNENEIKRDFNAIWDKDYKLLGCTIEDSRLQSILSEYCNRDKCNLKVDSFNLKLDNAISYNNRTTFANYHNRTGSELIVISVLQKYPQGLDRKRLEQALYSLGVKCSLMTNKTLRNILEKLYKLNLIELMETAKDRGNNYKNYFAKYIDQSTYGMGFTTVSNGAIMGAIDKRITPNQYKLYVLLLKYAFGKKESYPSTITMAKEMGTSRENISRETKALEKSGYIEKGLVYPKGVKTCIYRLLI